MPTAVREGPYRFFFVSFDSGEPTRVHVRRDDMEAKIWLGPVKVAFNHGFAGHEIGDSECATSGHHPRQPLTTDGAFL